MYLDPSIKMAALSEEGAGKMLFIIGVIVVSLVVAAFVYHSKNSKR